MFDHLIHKRCFFFELNIVSDCLIFIIRCVLIFAIKMYILNVRWNLSYALCGFGHYAIHVRFIFSKYSFIATLQTTNCWRHTQTSSTGITIKTKWWIKLLDRMWTVKQDLKTARSYGHLLLTTNNREHWILYTLSSNIHSENIINQL